MQKMIYMQNHLWELIPIPRFARLDASGILHHDNIFLGELCSGSCRQIADEARGSISWIAVRELGYSGADVARYLGVTNFCVTGFVASGKKPDVEDHISKLRTFCTNVPILYLKNMLKFIPGILLLQGITIVLILFVPGDLENWGWLRLAIPVLAAGFLTAFWFGSIAAHQRKDKISRLKEYHAKERETIRVNAERDKSKLVKQAQRKTIREVRRSSTRANIKIGLAFAGATGLGVLLLLTQYMSLGLLTLTTIGGALGGYVLRARQEKDKLNLPHKSQDISRMINATPKKTEDSDLHI